MFEELLKRIQYTGRWTYEDSSKAIFRHLIITKEELEMIEKEYDIEEFAEKYNISFISLECYGQIDFEHYTDVCNDESIQEKGLIISDSTWISDLNNGIYVIEEYDEDAKDNLNTYFEDKEEDDELLKVVGTYEGKYIKCIYGEGHENYIVIPTNIPSKDISMEIITIEDEFDIF